MFYESMIHLEKMLFYNKIMIVLCLSFTVKLCSGFIFSGKKNTTTPATPTTAASNITLGARKDDLSFVEYELGGILGVAFAVLVSAAFISVAGIIYLRRKRARDRVYRRQAHVMRESAKSAGVYRDTTTDDSLVAASYRESAKDYKTLYKNPNLYESDDSEDEF